MYNINHFNMLLKLNFQFSNQNLYTKNLLYRIFNDPVLSLITCIKSIRIF